MNIQDIERRIDARNKKNNAAFKKMTRAEKRVTIAKDVLKQVAAKRIVPNSGSFVTRTELETGFLPRNAGNTIGGEGPVLTTEQFEQTQYRDALKDVTRCNACAIGAAFLCAVERFDDATMEQLGVRAGFHFFDSVPWDKMFTYLRRFFSKSQLLLIEAAFERGGGVVKPNAEDFEGATISWTKKLKAAADYVSELDTDDRLVRIMRNIVRNGGEFVLPKRLLA